MKVMGVISRGPIEFLPDVSSTSAADIIKGDDVTVKVLFRTSRRWLARLRQYSLAGNAASDRWVKQNYCFLPYHRCRPKG